MAPPERKGTSVVGPASRPTPPGQGGGGLAGTLRLLACLLLLGLGSVLGWQARGLQLARPVSDGPAGELLRRRQELLAAGWKEVDGGVFARPCQAPCRPPRIFGGGAAAAVEVDCLQRPCGVITASFSLLDSGGRVVAERRQQREGRQGERLQLVAESDDPRVVRVELGTLQARAVENGG
jgi:hypothetical protein